MSFGEYIRRKRLLRNYTQAQIAYLLGVSQSTYSRIESDVQLPTFEQLERLFDTLSLSLDRYFTESKKNRVSKNPISRQFR